MSLFVPDKYFNLTLNDYVKVALEEDFTMARAPVVADSKVIPNKL